MADPIPAFCLLASLLVLAGVQLLDRYWVRPREQRKWEEAEEPNEIVFPARDEAAIMLLKSDPEEYFRQTHRPPPFQW